MSITNSDLVFISNLKFVLYDSQLILYITDYIVESGYDPKFFLGVTSKKCFFEDIAESNQSIFDFYIQERKILEKLTGIIIVRFGKKLLFINIISFIRKKLIVSSNALGVVFVTISFTN